VPNIGGEPQYLTTDRAVILLGQKGIAFLEHKAHIHKASVHIFYSDLEPSLDMSTVHASMSFLTLGTQMWPQRFSIRNIVLAAFDTQHRAGLIMHWTADVPEREVGSLPFSCFEEARLFKTD